MLRIILVIFALYGCAPEPPQSSLLKLDIIRNFNPSNKNYNTILNLRDDCFDTKSASGLLGKEVFVGVKNNIIIGFFSYKLQKNKTIAYIHDVCVGSKYRAVGIGSKLFNQGLNYLEAIPSLTALELDVYTDNEPAIKLYKSAGFKIINTFTEEGRELYRMKKELRS